MTFAHHQDALLNRRQGNQLQALLVRSLRHDTIVALRPDAVEIAFCDLKAGLLVAAVPRRPVDQSRTDALTGIIGARRACTVSMISPLSIPCR